MKRKRKLKAYQYKNFNTARRHGYTLKKYKNSVRGKKNWDNLSDLKKALILENLIRGRLKMFVYEITSQSHYDARGTNKKTGKKYKTLFEYSTNGLFKNEPSIESLEKMVKNSLISAFNCGQNNNSYLKNSAFNTLVEGQLRGIKIEKIKVNKKKVGVLNKMSAELNINNNGSKWRGHN